MFYQLLSLQKDVSAIFGNFKNVIKVHNFDLCNHNFDL